MSMNRTHGSPALVWREAGARTAPPVVLLHSLGADSGMWDAQAQALAGTGHRVVMPDARGHGASAWAAPLSIDGWVTDLERVLAAAEVAAPILIGLSMGGVQALAYTLAHPDAVRGLVLADTFAQLDPDIAAAKIDQLSGDATRLGMQALADAYVRDTFTVDGLQAERALMRDAIASVAPDAYAASVRACFDVQLADRLAEVRCPTLVLWGERDHKSPRPLSERIAAGIPAAELVEIPRAGHLSNLENPGDFSAAITRFTGAHTPAGAATEG